MAIQDINLNLRQISADINSLSGKIMNYADDLPSLTGPQQTVLKNLLNTRIDALSARLTAVKTDVTNL